MVSTKGDATVVVIIIMAVIIVAFVLYTVARYTGA